MTPEQMIELAKRLEAQNPITEANMQAADLIRQMAEQQPVAAVTGYFGGHCVIAPMNPAAVFPANMALYTAPPAPQPDKTEQGRTRSTVLSDNVAALVDGGVPFLHALDATLKAYDHPAPQPARELPPLPDAVRMSSDQSYLGYTADQMRDYARAALAAQGIRSEE